MGYAFSIYLLGGLAVMVLALESATLVRSE